MPYSHPFDQADYARGHYERDKQAYKDRAAAFKPIAIARNRAFVDGYLATHPCVDCGEADTIVLEFDHVRGVKDGDISWMVNRPCGLVKIQEEIEKCEVRCANCHRRKTAFERGYVGR